MFLEFPGDRTTHHLDRQYMLGPSLLVAPVLNSQEEETEYYIPAGRWTYLWTNGTRTVDGPIWIKERVALDDIPIWVRPGSILCLGPEGTGRPDYDYAESTRVHVYGLLDGQVVKTDIPPQYGTTSVATIQAERKGECVTVKIVGECKTSSVTVLDKRKNVTLHNTEKEVHIDL